ncbi:histidine--tRNA ligase [Shimazuella sp. AN120528]|uniref:histidine--tRNA ligase n=1 Tax=Shimazuella soli TaxID=1892854 RepID=UPI001F0DBFAB|nr:histidine--tRNA ligase [Shimazuella soli]MCH5583636.1 histidine--tRNA ligase [Shimazuella soli]
MGIPRGTYDILPNEVTTWHYLEKTAREICARYAYEEVRTPIFEETSLYERGVGETTDIVEKEMYTFLDRKKRSLTLRPEGTAGVVRSFVENKMYGESLPVKLYYFGPMFRYERPQAGRYRQFHQFGVEVFGSDDPALDAEVISLGLAFYRSLGISGVQVGINNVGTPEIRAKYFEKLIEYFAPFEAELDQDAKSRLYRNPMRILDSKVKRTQEIAEGAPSILDSLDKASMENFERVQSYLQELQVPFQVNDRLVRGLDYYTQTAFEFMIEELGAQAGVIGGGGRYNGLVQELGGPEVSGIGFGIGLERVILALKEQNVAIPSTKPMDCFLVTMGEQAQHASVRLLGELRGAGLKAERDYLDRKMKAQFKAANRYKARYVAVLGDEELASGKIQVKQMETGEQKSIAMDQLVSYLLEGK